MEYHSSSSSSEDISDDGTSSGSYEIAETITSAVQLMNQFMQHVSHPPRPILTRKQVERDREAANEMLMPDYFYDEPLYGPREFRCRFRMSKRLFLLITKDLEEEYDYFKQRPDARKKMGFTALQKCTSAIRTLAYGNATDAWDEYLKMADKTSRDTLDHFALGICQLYGARYLRKPTWKDLQRIYDVHEAQHGLPSMIGSIDCKHWGWTNCPTAWRGGHTRGDQKGPSIILQAIESYDLWIWHLFFGVSGSNNDINVFEQSPIIEDVIAGNVTKASFWANGNEYDQGYFLADGIYPQYTIVVKTFRHPIDEKRAHFAKLQESTRKDIERVFGVLQQRWHFVRYPCRLWEKEKIRNVMYACIILHNMILEDEGKAICQDYDPTYVEAQQSPATMEQRLQNAAFMRNSDAHNRLMEDLVHHAWMRRALNESNQSVTDDEDDDDEDDGDNE